MLKYFKPVKSFMTIDYIISKNTTYNMRIQFILEQIQNTELAYT